MNASKLPGYRAARDSAAIAVRRGRRFLGIDGKASREMLNGLLSNSPPPVPSPIEGDWLSGSVVYSTLLTPKGRMITDLRNFADPETGTGPQASRFLLDLPEVGCDQALAHFRKYLPPRFAKVADLSGKMVLLTLVGPGAPTFLTRCFAESGLPEIPGDMAELAEGRELVLLSQGDSHLRITRNGDLAADAWDVLAAPGWAARASDWAEARGVPTLSEAVLSVLRVEKGRPAFGMDMDENTIPNEAGIQTRAIDPTKGCYTGQEVIVRIRDRGQVNKQLKGFLLGDAPVPIPGQELFHEGRDKPVGWITSAVASPAFGQTIALGYLRRGLETGVAVRVGGPGGPLAEPRALDDEGWLPG